MSLKCANVIDKKSVFPIEVNCEKYYLFSVTDLQGLTKRMKKVTPLFDTKIRLNCYFLPIN